MFLPDASGGGSSKLRPLTGNVTPQAFEYGSMPPEVDRPYPYTELYLGIGERMQGDGTPRRIAYGINIDSSIDGKWMLGPGFTTETINAGQPIRGFVKALHSGSEVIWALAGNKMFRRTADAAWTDSHTLGAAGATVQAIRFKDTAANDRLYVATSAGNLLSYDGATWTLSGAGAGPAGEKCRAIERVDNDLIVGYDNKITSAQADPRLRGSWGPVFTVGDASSAISWIRAHRGVAWIFKPEGPYTLDPAGDDVEHFESLRNQAQVNNGVNAAPFLNKLWAPWRDALYTIGPNGELDTAGSEILLENGTEVQGQVVGTAGHRFWFNYVLVYNSVNGNSYLLKYGSWALNPQTERLSQFFGVYCGAIAKFSSKQGTCIEVLSMSATGNDRLYIGFLDGTGAWTALPRFGPSPAADSGCSFATTGDVFLPRHHGGYRVDQKGFIGYSVPATFLNANNYAKIAYRTDPTASFVPHVLPNGGAALYTLPGQRVDYTEQTKIAARLLDVRVTLEKGIGAATTETPILDGLVIHERVRPNAVFDYSFQVIASNYAVKHNGTVDRRSAKQIRDAMKAAVASVNTVAVTLPEEETIEVAFLDYKEDRVPWLARDGLAWLVTISGVQFVATLGTGSPAGAAPGLFSTLNALSLGTMQLYTLGQLEDLV